MLAAKADKANDPEQVLFHDSSWEAPCLLPGKRTQHLKRLAGVGDNTLPGNSGSAMQLNRATWMSRA